jgi:hypothetical protein
MSTLLEYQGSAPEIGSADASLERVTSVSAAVGVHQQMKKAKDDASNHNGLTYKARVLSLPLKAAIVLSQ